MKRILCLIFTIFSALLSVSCFKIDLGEPICVFLDNSGYEVKLYSKPKNVAVLFSSFAEMWNLAGGHTSITVGESVERGFVPQGTKLVDGGAGKQINVELLVSYKPDFVIASSDIPKQVEAVSFLRSQGVPCALFKVDSFLDYKNAMQKLTQVTENQTAYETNVLQVENEIANQKQRINATNAKKILFLRAFSTGAKAKASNDNFVCKMLNELYAENIADEAPVLLDGLNEEVILINNPEIIFISTMGSEQSAKNYIENYFSTTLSSLSAVKNNSFYYLDKNLFHFKPNARWYLAYKTLIDIILNEYEN
ncbi:MAG: ABC transporter substrate-binding protein [Clostridia bacterium]|nr:ABC transporter substrate-binding protein [Clostridia bacterium]